MDDQVKGLLSRRAAHMSSTLSILYPDDPIHVATGHGQYLYDTAGRQYLVRGRGLFLGVEIVTDADSRTPQPALARRITLELRHAGILISTDGPDNNVLKIKPPMPFGRDDADAPVTAIRRSVRGRGTGA